MKSNNWIGHSGYGGQFLMINLETNVVASFFLFRNKTQQLMKTIKPK